MEATAENVAPERERKSDRRPAAPARSVRQPSQPSPANDDRRERRSRHRDHDDGGPTPVGFGDDIPAFMLIVASAGKV